MRRITLGNTAIETSCVGFGCASLGSRVAARAGIDALTRAYDAGVTWFDVAPAYGAGEAEAILGNFIAGRRTSVQVLTKVGLAPPARAALLKAAHAALRPAAGLLRGLRKQARALGATRNMHLAITPDLIERSIAASLKALQTDHVDVLALHDPDPASVARDDILLALERVLRRGQARAVGVAGSLEACHAAARCGAPYALVQTAVVPGSNVFADLRRGAKHPLATVGHSVFGIGGALDAFVTRMRSDAAFAQSLRAAGYAGSDREIAGAVLIETALRQNRDGITLLSMFSADHLTCNLGACERVKARAPVMRLPTAS